MYSPHKILLSRLCLRPCFRPRLRQSDTVWHCLTHILAHCLTLCLTISLTTLTPLCYILSPTSYLWLISPTIYSIFTYSSSLSYHLTAYKLLRDRNHTSRLPCSPTTTVKVCRSEASSTSPVKGLCILTVSVSDIAFVWQFAVML